MMDNEWKNTHYKNLIKKSYIPPKYLRKIDMYVEGEDKEAYETLRELGKDMYSFVSNGNNLLLHSRYVGNGKTLWSTILLKNYFKDALQNDKYYISGLFVNVPELLIDIKNGFNDIELQLRMKDTQDRIKTDDLVVFDDIGVKDLSEYDKNLVYSWINYRDTHLKSSIFTTNLYPDDLYNSLGTRVADRILDSRIIEFNGGSYRGE